MHPRSVTPIGIAPGGADSEADIIRRIVVLLLVLSYAGWLGASWAATPDRSAGATGTFDRPVLVGDQGPFENGAAIRIGRTNGTWRYQRRVDRVLDVDPLEGNRVLLTFTHEVGTQTVTGVRIVAHNKSTLWEWRMPIDEETDAEIHDADRLPNGRILVADMHYERILILARNGTIVWQWNASRFYDVPPDPTAVDWLHINDVDRIGPGRYLVSVRNANQIVIVERGRGVTSVINRDRTPINDRNCRLNSGYRDDGDPDGSVRCGDPALLDHQHNPQWLGEGRVLVADSGNDRVVELARRDGAWRPVWTRRGAGGVGFDWPRDADRLPSGATLITDTQNDRIVVIGPDGNFTWSYVEPGYVYEADVGGEYPAGPPRTSETTQARVVPRWLDLLYGGVRWVLPVPYWVTEWQVLAGLGLGGVFVGMGVYRAYRRVVTR